MPLCRRRRSRLGGGIGAAGGVQQDIATTPGEPYYVAFSLAGNWGGAPTVKTLRVSAAGATQDYTFDTTGRNNSDMGWVERVFSFTAASSTTTLTFETLDADFGAAIDDVHLTSAPAVPAMHVAGRALLTLILIATGAWLSRPGRDVAGRTAPRAGGARLREPAPSKPPTLGFEEESRPEKDQWVTRSTPAGFAGPIPRTIAALRSR